MCLLRFQIAGEGAVRALPFAQTPTSSTGGNKLPISRAVQRDRYSCVRRRIKANMHTRTTKIAAQVCVEWGWGVMTKTSPASNAVESLPSPRDYDGLRDRRGIRTSCTGSAADRCT